MLQRIPEHLMLLRMPVSIKSANQLMVTTHRCRQTPATQPADGLVLQSCAGGMPVQTQQRHLLCIIVSLPVRSENMCSLRAVRHFPQDQRWQSTSMSPCNALFGCGNMSCGDEWQQVHVTTVDQFAGG